MYNALTTPEQSTEQRLKVINVLKDVISAYRSGAITTREELLREYIAALNTLYQSIESTLLEHTPVVPDTAPTIQHQNEDVSQTNRDLNILFSEMNLLGTYMVNLLNQISSEKDDLQGRVKRTASKLADYQLYRGTTGLVISEGFVDSRGLDIGSPLLSEQQCNFSYSEGAATLAVVTQNLLPIDKVEIDPQTFTGVVGSLEDVNADSSHAVLSDMTDNNPDSWTEFELTYFADEDKPTNLEATLLLTLKDPKIVNHIVIDPINFGLLNGVIVQDIKVSSDGTEWISVRNDMPLADYSGETPEDVFLLSPASGKFSGVFTYTFLPRKAKYISITLTQDTPYLIQTVQGNKYRLAIGIRSIDIYSNKYAAVSELVSTVRDVAGIIRKLALLSAYIPDETSQLADVKFFVSFDDGENWTPIQPLTEDDWEQLEVLNVDGDYKSLRFKITLQRNDEVFASASSITGEEEVKQRLDIVKTNTSSSPQQITPSKPLANANVTVIDAPLGSRSNDWIGRPKIKIGTGTGDELTLTLPFDLYPISNIRTDEVRVFVSGVEWTQTYDISSASATARVYEIDAPRKIVFGDNINGLSPATNADIEIMLTAETVFFERFGEFYTYLLKMPCDGYKRHAVLEHALPPSPWNSARLTPSGNGMVDGKYEYVLPVDQITSFDLTELLANGSVPGTSVFNTRVYNLEDVDATGKWFFDLEKGSLYSYDTFTPARRVTVRYKYTKHVEQDLDLVKSGTNIQQAQILLDSLVTHRAVDVTGQQTNRWGFFDAQPSNTSVVDGNLIRLSHGSLVRGSVSLEPGIFGSGDTYRPVEVDFVNGNTELYNVLDVNEEAIADTTLSGQVHSFTLQGGGSIDQAYGVVFDDDGAGYFTTWDTTPTASGEYYINYITGTVYVYLTSGMENVVASYAYVEGQDTAEGTYSIDYKNGIIFCKTVPVSGYEIAYKFSKYRIHYNMGRAIDSSLIEIDVEKNQISVETDDLKGEAVHVLFEYLGNESGSLQEIVEYFTPVVRDLRLRVILDGMVI